MKREREIPVCDCGGDHEHLERGRLSEIPGENTVTVLADFFKLFADETRLRILFALDTSEMCVCDIAAAVGMTKSAVSHQLRALRQSRLIKSRKSGKNVYYSLADSHVEDIIEKALEHAEE